MKLSELAATVPVHRVEIAEGVLGTNQTVDKMKKVILASLGDQLVRMTAERLITNVDPNDKEMEASVIYQFVRDRVHYVRDPRGLEYIQTPNYLLKAIEKNGKAFGDCDDKTVLGLALLKNIGYDVAIRVAGYREPKVYTHVYGLIKLYNQWIPFDATPTDKQLGWEHPYKTIKDYPIDPYGYEMGEIVAGEINIGQLVQLALGIALGTLLSTTLIKR